MVQKKEYGHFSKLKDVSGRNSVNQQAIAKSSLEISPELYESLQRGPLSNAQVLHSAKAAGTLAAKNASTLLPYLHTKQLTTINIEFSWKVGSGIWELLIEADVKAKHAESVESEALACVSATALTVFDICKEEHPSMVIGPTYLSRKRG
ncbi:cyclic pyranopterin monophosphate synthase MoaC [Shouchella shacheensis]|uniref:cyclic pyranopterin monophosphate synthase MoaC n=1 Tax=Shouchella shacheensis TaxID=1649580 RepID=UPI0007404A4C|nr:cyclic pyranopterin monophosphate synthase MoaC [Shouchella shacheensis]